MVTITDNEGTDLVASPPVPVRTVADPVARLSLSLIARELDTELPLQSLTGTINWNDGREVTTLAGTGTLVIAASRDLGPGDYVIALTVRNYELPQADIVTVNIPVSVIRLGVPTTLVPILYGPILPRDQGFPGPQDWLFHSGSDLGILESSLKMLLTTTKGERVMEPGYGTNLRRTLFEPNTGAVDTIVREEIIGAVAQWEPRVELRYMEVNRDPNAREATVLAQFVSKVSGRDFELVLRFTP